LVSIVDNDTYMPLEGVEVHAKPIGDQSRLISPNRHEALGRSDSRGVVTIDIGDRDNATASALLCWRRDYLAASLFLGEERDYDVRMKGGGSVVVRCIDENGIGVAGCRVVLCTEATVGLYYSDDGIGSPFSDRPVWSRTSNSHGDASFTGLPVGNYGVVLRHPAYHAVRCDPIAAGGPFWSSR